MKLRSYLRIQVMSLLPVVALLGCVHTVTDLPAPASTLAPQRIRKIPVDVLIGDDKDLQTYTPEKITQRLHQVNQLFQDQSIPLVLQAPALLKFARHWNEVNLHDMSKLRAKPDALLLVITKKIKSCGEVVGDVVGCTPRIGHAVVFVSADATNYVAPESLIWAHEIGHAAGLLHAKEDERLMSARPTATSVKLSAEERQKISQLTRKPSAESMPVLKAALGIAPQVPMRHVLTDPLGH